MITTYYVLNKLSLIKLREHEKIAIDNKQISFVFESDMLDINGDIDYSFLFTHNKTLYTVSLHIKKYDEDETEPNQCIYSVRTTNKSKANDILLKGTELIDIEINNDSIDQIILEYSDIILERILKILNLGVEI